MEVKESKRGKNPSHRGAPCRDSVAPGASTSLETHSLKNFTIPKIRRAAEKVCMSACHTNRREYSSISHTLSQCRLDLSCELQSSWQFGETKLVHNEYLEKKFSAKRTEMRERGRRGRELEEHYCFLALSHSAVSRMYQSGLCTRESTMKALGNPLLGVYLFRHTDVALNYARSRKRHVDNIMIFKVLYGKVKKIQPVVDKSKACLDPSPNFDCHMSRLVPTPKDPIDQQAQGSAVYLYEYNTLSKPVDKPRQCLPYATVTVRFLGQKADSGPTLTSLRFLSAGFSKWPEKRDSLNNCTIAKRIGKGKDATVIYEHFPKPADSSAQDSCSCSAEMNALALDISSPCGSAQNNGFFAAGALDGRTEPNVAESHSQLHPSEASPPQPPSLDAPPNVDSDLLVNFKYLEKFLSALTAVVTTSHSLGTSTVTTSKLIKDPRLLRRGGSCDQANPETDSRETWPLESREECPDALLSLTTEAALPSETLPAESLALGPSCPEALPHGNSLKGMFYQNRDNRALQEVVMDRPKDHCDDTDVQGALSCTSKEVVPERENQESSDQQVHHSSQMNRILLPIKKQARGKYISDSPRKDLPMDTSPEKLSNPISQPSDFKTVNESLQPSSLPEPLQAQKETRNKYIQDTHSMESLSTNPKSRQKHSKRKESYNPTPGERSSTDLILPHEKPKTLILSHHDAEDCRKPPNQELPITTQLSFFSPGKVRKCGPCLTENGYPDLSAQKSSKSCLEEWLKCERMYIDKYFSKSTKVTELKRGSLPLAPFGTKATASQQMDIIVQQTKEKPNDLINLSFNAKMPCSEVIGEGSDKYLTIHRENENKAISSADPCEDGGLDTHLADEGDGNQDCPVFCDPMFGDEDTCFPDLNVYFREQEFRSEESGDPHPKREGRESPSVEQKRVESIYVNAKQVVYVDEHRTTLANKEREIQNAGRAEVVYSEKFSTFNLAWKKSYVSIETAKVENENRMTPGNQGGRLVNSEGKTTPPTCRDALPEAMGSSAVHVGTDSGANTATPAPLRQGFNTAYRDHQGDFLEFPAQAGPSPSSGAWERPVFGEHHDNMGYCEPKEARGQPTTGEVLEVLIPQDLDFDNEIEVEFESCEGSFLCQDTTIRGNLPADEMSSVYQLLESRINWAHLLGSSSWKPSEVSKSTSPQEAGSRYFLKERSCFYSRTQKNHRVVVPDLQIQITNIQQSAFTLSQEPRAEKDQGLVCASPEAAEREMSNTPREFEPMASPSHFTCEDAQDPSEGELDPTSWPKTSNLERNSIICPLLESSVHMAAQYPLASPPQPALASETTKKEWPCPLAKPRNAHNKASREKGTESKNSKGRQPPASLKDKIMPSRSFRYPEPGGITRKTLRRQSSEQFSSLSEGRIKTFSQSERYIRNVLNALYSEASLCKSRRLSRKLDQAVVHLKKAHRRVHRSLQLITKVGEKRRKSPLPKSYEFIRNSLWECCDLEGYNFLTERRYYSRHCWQKRKDDKQEEKRAAGLEMAKSRTPAPHHKGHSSSSRNQGVRRSLSTEGLSNEISISRLSISRNASPDTLHHSESRGSASGRHRMRDPRGGSNLQAPDGQPEAFFSPHLDKERRLDLISLSDVSSKEVSAGGHSVLSRMGRNVKFLSNLGENSLPLDTNKLNVDGEGETHSRVNPDIFISVLKSTTEHFINVDTSKTDDPNLPTCPPKLEGYLPAEKSPTLAMSSKLRADSEPGVRGLDNMAPWTSQEGESILLNLSCVSVKNDEAEWWIPHSGELSKRQPPLDGVAPHHPSLQEEHLQLQNDKEDTLNMIWDLQEGRQKEESGPENALVGPEENKNCKSNAVEVLLLNNTFLENTKHCSSQKFLVKEKAKTNWTEPLEREHQSEEPEESSVLTGLFENVPIQVEGQNKEGQGLDTSGVAASWKTPSPLGRTKEEKGRMEVGKEPTVSLSKLPAPKRKGVPQTRARQIPSGIPGADPAQQPLPTSKARDPTTLIPKLSKILQKADKASTLKSLQEQTKACQAVLPLFIEAFERKQKCSFKEVLISRELLVEGNGWDNCRHCLHPQAVDALVELQMMMETIQFVENKKSVLGGKPTFRSLLWYDPSLYGELLRGDQGFQQQACLYPAFQERIKYNAFSELQLYRDQLIQILQETRKENGSYYAVLKYKRQIEECEDAMQHSNYFDFTLSAPFTCGVNFGDNLEDLEHLRKSTLELISSQDHVPKVHSCPGKQDHLWIIMEMISSKMYFIKNSESVSIKIALYGLEHIFFDAAKSLVWEERGLSISKNDSPEKRKEELLQLNQEALRKLQQICDSLEASGRAEPASQGWLEELVGNVPNKPSDCLKGEGPSVVSFRASVPPVTLPDICCVGEILDQAESADLRHLQELVERCVDHVETFKKSFQILQMEEAAVDSLLITEDNVLDVDKKASRQAVLLKPEAVEIYIELAMLSETIHFLKNLMAKKLDKPRFRSMLWFDLSLLPDLIRSQEKMGSFLFLKENREGCPWEAVEAVILELKDEMSVIGEYPEGNNSSYALQLLSRELAELSEIRTLLEQAIPPITTYVDLVPYTMTVNYGTTLSELEHNYNQFAVLLKNLTLASQKDLGKMAHIMKIMKTIEHLKASGTQMRGCDASLLTCQMFANAEKAHQQGSKETGVIHEMKPKMAAGKLGTCWEELPSPPDLPHQGPAVSKKRPLALAPWESNQEPAKSPDPPSCKKPKIGDLLTTEVRQTEEPEGPLQDPREKTTDGGGPADHTPHLCLSRPEEWTQHRTGQDSPGPICPLLLQGPTQDSHLASRGLAGQQGSLEGTRGRDLPGSRRKRSLSEGALPDTPGLPSQTLETPLSPHPRPGADTPQAAPFLTGANFHSEGHLHSVASVGSACVHPDHEMLPDGSGSAQLPKRRLSGHTAVPTQPGCPGPSKLLSGHNRFPDPLLPHQPGQRAEPPNHPDLGAHGVYPFLPQQQQPENRPEVFMPAPGGCWNGSLQRTPLGPQAWGHSYSTFYPYYSLCVYHYCSSNGSSVTQTYQGIASYEGQPLPLAPFYPVPSNLLSCSTPGEPPRGNFGQSLSASGELGFCTSQGPHPCPAPQPFVTTPRPPGQTLRQGPSPGPPHTGSFPAVTCMCAPWQQGSFQSGH